MKIFRFYESKTRYSYALMFETTNREEMYDYIVDRIYRNELTYDPCCNYPNKDKQVELFTRHFKEHECDYISNILEGYIESVELDPNRSKTDRDSYIRLNLIEHYKEAQALNKEIFAIVIQGSQNYKLDTYSNEYWSDIDTKCITLPTLDDIILNKKPTSTTHERENKEHIDLKDIRLMFECFKKQNVNFVEVLFSEYYIVPDKYKALWDELRGIAEEIVHAHPAQTLRAMSGMSMEKFKALKHPYPTIVDKIDRFGYDPKQLHHIVRINDFIKKFVSGVPFKEAMVPDTKMKKYLTDIKLGKLKLSEAEKLAKEYDDDTKRIKDRYIEIHGDDIENPQAYRKLDDMLARVLKQYFKEVLRDNDN